MSDRQTIKTWSGKVIGFIDTSPNGDRTVRNFGGKVLGFYRKDRDVTVDFYGKIIAKGDACSMLLAGEQ